MIDNESKFGKECIRRGFARLAPHYYARCYGEGLYEVIYTGFRRYHSSKAIEENPALANHKSYYISISIRSLYWSWPELYFCDKRDQGTFSPGMLLYGKRNAPPFRGIQDEYRMMEQGGFDLLDQVKTQADMLELYREKANYFSRGIHNLALVASHLLCCNMFDAEVEVTWCFTQRMMGTFSQNQQLINEGRNEEFLDEIYKQMERSAHVRLLWNAFMGQRNDWLASFLTENYERNMGWVEKYGIPIHPNFKPCEIPADFFHRNPTG